MKSGKAELKAQVGGRGAVARVVIDLSPAERGCSVEFAEGYADKRHPEKFFADTARAGIQYAYESLVLDGQTAEACTVTIRELHAKVADSSSILLFYVAALALWDALGVAPHRKPEIVLERDRYIRFPF